MTARSLPASVEASHCVAVPLSGGRDYTIYLKPGMRFEAAAICESVARSRRIVVITQKPIATRWLDVFAVALRAAGFLVDVLTFPPGERYKTLRTVEKLCQGLYELSPAIDRKTLIVALGGGVVGDVAGFVASLYLRGLDYIQIPTTLLAMVDSSVGGKTGVDFHAGKNLVGAFHQPRAVLIDTELLATLPVREFNAGMAEVIKYGFIQDPTLFPVIADARNGTALVQVVRRSCEIKAEVVTRDEFETGGLRATLNFGHTIGHALEAITGYNRFKHGEAVAIGMRAAALIGEEAGITPPEIEVLLLPLLRAYALPSELPADIAPEALLPLLGRDKKAEGGKARFVLATAPGSVKLVDGITEAMILAGLHRMRGKAKFSDFPVNTGE